jgi:hypothetical protein
MIKEKYLEILNRFDNIANEFNFDDSEIKTLKNNIENIELIVPIVGAFSAGKSTLINKFLKTSILPVGISPETSLATELRFSEIEKIEAIKENEIEEFRIDGFDKIKKRSKEFKYLKLFLNNENLREIAPFVLVDMPGFDSPIKLHNEAIVYYLQKGVHFIVLINVEDGGISKSLIREIENILEFKAGVTIALSKTDLLSVEEVAKIKNYIEEQLESELDIKKDVLILDNEKGLKDVILSLNIDEIYKSLFLDSLKILYFEIEQRVNSYENSLKNSKEKSLKEIENLKNSIQQLHRKKEKMIEKIENKYSRDFSQNIVNSVINEIVLHQERIIEIALKDKEAFERELNEIVRHKLIFEIKRGLEKISSDIIDDFRIEVGNLDIEIEDKSKWINEVLENSKRVLNNTNNTLQTIANTIQKNSKMYKAITTILGITTTILNPILEVAIIFLPEIIQFFTNSDKTEEAKKELRKKFKSEILPTLKIKLQSKVDEVLDEEIRLIIETVNSQFEQEFEIKSEEIQKAIEYKKVNSNEISTIVNKIEKEKRELQKEMNKII